MITPFSVGFSFGDHWKNVRHVDLRGLKITESNNVAPIIQSWLDGTLAGQLETFKVGYRTEHETFKFQLLDHPDLIQWHRVMVQCSNSLRTLFLNDVRRERLTVPLPSMSHLERLNVPYYPQALSPLLQAVGAATLVDLNVRASAVFDDVTLQLVAARFPSLQRLNVSCTGVSALGVRRLMESECVRRRQLRDLDLCYCERLQALSGADFGELICGVAKLLSSNLRMLGIGGMALRDDDARQLFEHCTAVEHLGIGGCTQLSEVAVSWIVGTLSSTLRNLNAHRLRQVSAGTWQQMLAQCRRLKVLDISDGRDTTLSIQINWKKYDDEDW
jgi:hypothetical protein